MAEGEEVQQTSVNEDEELKIEVPFTLEMWKAGVDRAGGKVIHRLERQGKDTSGVKSVMAMINIIGEYYYKTGSIDQTREVISEALKDESETNPPLTEKSKL